MSVALATVLVLISTLSAPALPAQDTTPSTEAPTTTLPTTTTADPARRAALEGEIAALENQLVDLDGAIPQKEAGVAQAEQTVVDFDGLLAANQSAIDVNIAAHDAPERAREELVLALYIGGSTELRSFSDFARNGEFSNESLRLEELFAAAEEGARARLAELDAEAAALATERQSLQTQRDQAAANAEAARVDLAATRDLRVESERQLERARADLKALLALSARAPLTGATNYPIRPAVGVKIDNSWDARPQTGLTRADIVYDIIVEGGITRFLAVFQSQDATRIGPVRSARTSDISIMAGYNNPLFAFSGGNDGVLAAVRVSPMISLSESSAPRAFVRDEGRFAPYNLYTSTAGLYAADPGNAGVPNPQLVFRQAGEASVLGRPASSVTVNIGFETVTYNWNGSSWDRFTNGDPTEDTTAGQVSPQNVIVQFINYGVSPADTQSPDALTVGQGVAWVLTDGKVIEARWARGIATSPVQFLDAANEQIPLTPGQTWIEMPQPGSASVG